MFAPCAALQFRSAISVFWYRTSWPRNPPFACPVLSSEVRGRGADFSRPPRREWERKKEGRRNEKAGDWGSGEPRGLSSKWARNGPVAFEGCRNSHWKSRSEVRRCKFPGRNFALTNFLSKYLESRKMSLQMYVARFLIRPRAATLSFFDFAHDYCMEGVVQKFWKTLWHKDWTFLYFPANFEKIISWNSAAIGVKATPRTRENTRSDIARSRISPAVRFPLKTTKHTLNREPRDGRTTLIPTHKLENYSKIYKFNKNVEFYSSIWQENSILQL